MSNSFVIGTGKYTLVFETDPLELTQTEVAALMAMTAKLTELSRLPDYEPTDIVLTLDFTRTGHMGTARLELTNPGKSS